MPIVAIVSVNNPDRERRSPEVMMDVTFSYLLTRTRFVAASSVGATRLRRHLRVGVAPPRTAAVLKTVCDCPRRQGAFRPRGNARGVGFAVMVIGRSSELEGLDFFLQRLRDGDGQAVLIRGAPGIGKTALLHHLVERCGDEVLVLGAAGVETESELVFAALADLLGPVIEHRKGLPLPQASALAGALALGPPAPGDRLAVCVAALSVLRFAAAARPVLVVVDDLHWLDAASRECVLYVARRAGGSLAVALAVREPCDAVLERTRLPELRLGPLEVEHALKLLEHTFADLVPPVAAAVSEAAAGNPLALVELAGSLSVEERCGVSALRLPLEPPGRLQEAFAARAGELRTTARRALLVAAAYEGEDLVTVAAACRGAESDADHLAEAEARGLVRLEPGCVRFTHPLVRGAVYQRADPAERRRVHRALADVLDQDGRTWHLAAAAVGADDNVAAQLEALGGRAAARRGYAAASAALERAAMLSGQRSDAARRLMAAGQAAAFAGSADRAIGLLEQAVEAASGEIRIRAQHLRGRLLVWRGRAPEGIEILVTEGEQARAIDSTLAAAMLADAAVGATTVSAHLRAEQLAQDAISVLGDDGKPAGRASVLAMVAWVFSVRGQASKARPILAEAARPAAGVDPLGPDWPWVHLLLRAKVTLGEFEQVQGATMELCERAREAGALAVLGGAVLVAGDVAFRLGQWDVADEQMREAIRVTAETGHPSLRGLTLTAHSRLLAARGAEDESRSAAVTALRLAEADGIRAGLRHVHAALGFLELSADRVGEAIRELETVARLADRRGVEEPTNVPWLPDLVEAYARAGRAQDAWRALDVLVPQARATGSAVAGAAEARCRGILEPDFDAAFAESLALHDLRPMPFERARTLLALGRRLHRARRRAEARDRLREALDGFERLEATAWARQARHELRAAGGRTRRAGDGGLLSPQELRVAAAVGRGASNREIASELFLAPKTIEFHLRQIYRKLGVRSRPALVAALAARAAGDAPRPPQFEESAST